MILYIAGGKIAQFPTFYTRAFSDRRKGQFYASGMLHVCLMTKVLTVPFDVYVAMNDTPTALGRFREKPCNHVED